MDIVSSHYPYNHKSAIKFDILRPKQKGRYFAYGSFECTCVYSKENKHSSIYHCQARNLELSVTVTLSVEFIIQIFSDLVRQMIDCDSKIPL